MAGAPVEDRFVIVLAHRYVPARVEWNAKGTELDWDELRHILTRHHQRHWDGSIKKTQTFLNPNRTVADVRGLVHAALKQGSGTLKSRGTGSTFTLNGTLTGVSYTLKISNGRVVQFHPRPCGSR